MFYCCDFISACLISHSLPTQDYLHVQQNPKKKKSLHSAISVANKETHLIYRISRWSDYTPVTNTNWHKSVKSQLYCIIWIFSFQNVGKHISFTFLNKIYVLSSQKFWWVINCMPILQILLTSDRKKAYTKNSDFII